MAQNALLPLTVTSLTLCLALMQVTPAGQSGKERRRRKFA